MSTNPQNLRPPFSPEEAREMGRKGAAKSAEVRRKKKNLRELAQALLEAEGNLTPEEKKELEAMGMEPTQGAALVAAMYKKGKKGAERAAEFVRDTSGQAPKQQTQITIGEGMTPDEIRNLSDSELAAILAGDGEPAEK